MQEVLIISILAQKGLINSYVKLLFSYSFRPDEVYSSRLKACLQCVINSSSSRENATSFKCYNRMRNLHKAKYIYKIGGSAYTSEYIAKQRKIPLRGNETHHTQPPLANLNFSFREAPHGSKATVLHPCNLRKLDNKYIYNNNICFY